MSETGFDSPEDAVSRLADAGYVLEPSTATVVYLADALEKPLLVEGPAGVGKTDLAVRWADATGRRLIRLQCYEGLDEARALYEWEYGKQLLYAQLVERTLDQVVGDASSLADALDAIGDAGSAFFSERFLASRPVLNAIRAEDPVLLLIDEVDKADPEFEAFLLEVLASYQVTVPELGTFTASRPPRVVLTSNRTREMSDALKRRCLHLTLPFPTTEQERAILAARVPGLDETLAKQVVGFLSRLRQLDLAKQPAVGETLDWARALVVMGAGELDESVVESTLSALLKTSEDGDLLVESLDRLLD